MKAENIVREKSYAFALCIVKAYKYLAEEKKEYVLSKQLLRSGTSVGANIEEAIGGQTPKDFFAKQMASISTPYKTQAAGILADLNSVIESEDLQAQQEVAISAKIDEDFKALPRKLQIEIGEIGGKTVSPVDYDVSETDLAEIRDMLKDTAKRNNFLFNTDGSLNTPNLISVLTKAKMFDSATKVSYLSGMDSQVKAFQKIFPAGSAQEIGVGGSSSKPNGNQNGKPASFGKPQRVQPQRN